MNQEQLLLQYLKERGEITTLTAMNDLGISRLSNVIHDLKNHGNVILSEYVTSNNRYGEPCTYKVYWLGGEDNEDQNAD